jgi:hypothetical protein
MIHVRQRPLGLPSRPHPIRALALEAIGEGEPEWLKDLRLFATGWLAGLIFFGTLLA